MKVINISKPNKELETLLKHYPNSLLSCIGNVSRKSSVKSIGLSRTAKLFLKIPKLVHSSESNI